MGKFARNFDWITGLLLLCLGSFGLFLLLTIGTGVFYQQLLFLFIGFILLLICSRVDAVILWWLAPIGYVLGNIFLLMSYLGPNIRGATRWIMIGSMQIQPSELSKPFFILAFAYFISKYNPRFLKYLPLHIVLFLIPFLLVFKQPDLGSSLVYASFWIAMQLAGGLPIMLVAASAGIMTLFAPVAWSVLLPYQRDRIFTFLNPALDPRGAGYNALQAMIAVGSGQFIGRGLGRGTQSHLRFLPEHHTDFIFATLVEELGFVGGLLLFVLYALLLMRIILPFFRGVRHDAGVFIYSFGLFAMLFSQIFINTGMNMGLIPITGITLPFVSYGGSSILSLAIAFGFLWALQRGKLDDQAIAIR
jgi:rod shape determining protein RodA